MSVLGHYPFRRVFSDLFVVFVGYGSNTHHSQLSEIDRIIKYLTYLHLCPEVTSVFRIHDTFFLTAVIGRNGNILSIELISYCTR